VADSGSSALGLSLCKSLALQEDFVTTVQCWRRTEVAETWQNSHSGSPSNSSDVRATAVRIQPVFSSNKNVWAVLNLAS